VDRKIINFSCYQFAPLDHLQDWKSLLKTKCLDHGIKGLILLAPEGINFSLSGAASQLDSILQIIRSIPGLATIRPKESLGTDRPFQRMLVKIKKEIVSFGVEGVDPPPPPPPQN
jgi:UPF0176 protein